MFATRSIGIRALSLFWQLVIVTATFWSWLFVWQNSVFDEGANLQRYAVYYEFLMIGVVFGFGTKPDNGEAKKDWLLANRRSLRQAFFALFGVFLVVFAVKDA